MPANIRASQEVNSQDMRIKSRNRLLKDFHDFIHHGVEGLSVSPINDNIYHLSACIEGPPDTPYEDGIFWIDIQIPEEYPFYPPKMRFITKVYHPNIDSRGAICVDFLEKGKWYPTYRIQDVLLAITSLLAHPTTEDVEEPLVPEIAETYIKDYEMYCQNARNYTNLYARNLEVPEISS
jgi:ubiquitin-protein ligase